MMPGVGEALGQLAIIGEQQQSLRKIVKSANRIQPERLVFRRKAIQYGGPAFRIAHCANHMNVISLVLTLLIAIPVGIVSACRQNSLLDKSVTVLVFLGFAMQHFSFILTATLSCCGQYLRIFLTIF